MYIGSHINNIIMIGKLIRSLFYIKKENKRNKSNIYASIKSIKFSFCDKFYLITGLKMPKIFKNKNKTEQIYKVGEQMVQNEVNMFTILETLMKIKASLTVLVGDDEEKLS